MKPIKIDDDLVISISKKSKGKGLITRRNNRWHKKEDVIGKAMSSNVFESIEVVELSTNPTRPLIEFKEGTLDIDPEE